MTIAEANEPLSNGLKIIIAQKGLKNLYVAENAGYTPQELSDINDCVYRYFWMSVSSFDSELSLPASTGEHVS